MIYVRVELWPLGDRQRAKVLGEATIANDGTGTATKGNYDVRLSRTGGVGDRDPTEFANVATDLRNVYRQARVEGYPRAALVMWHLIAQALTNAVDSPPLKTRARGAPAPKTAQEILAHVAEIE